MMEENRINLILLRAFAESFLAQNGNVREQLCRRHGGQDPLDLIEREFQNCAYFKLPEDIEVLEEAEKDEELCDLATDPAGFVTKEEETARNRAKKQFKSSTK
jgi:hypothetical protein